MTKLRKLNARAWLISKLRSYSPLAFALSLFVVGVLLSGSISSLIYIQYKKMLSWNLRASQNTL